MKDSGSSLNDTENAPVKDAPVSQHSTLLILGIGLMLGEMSLFIVPLLVGNFMESYGLSEGEVGLLIAFRLAFFAVVSFGLATRIHKWDRRTIAFLGAAIIVLSYLGSAAAPSAPTFVISRVMLGVGEACVITAVTAIAAGLPRPEQAFSIMFSWVVVQAVGMFLLLPFLLSSLTLASTFLVIAGIAGLASLTFVWLTSRAAAPRSHKTADNVLPWRVVTIGLLCAFLLLNVSANTPWFYLERIAVRIDIEQQELGVMLAIATIVALLGPLCAHQLSVRLGRLLPIALGLSLLAAVALLMTHTREPYVFAVSLSASTAALGFTAIYLLGLASEFDPTGRLAAGSQGFIAIGNTLAPGVGGAFLLAGGSYEHLGWTALIASTIAICAVAPAARSLDRAR